MTRRSRQQTAPYGPTRETATTTTKIMPAARQYRPPTYHQCGAWSNSLSLMRLSQHERHDDARSQRQQDEVSHPRPHAGEAETSPQQDHGRDDLGDHADAGAPARRLPSEIGQRHRAGGQREYGRHQRDQRVGTGSAVAPEDRMRIRSSCIPAFRRSTSTTSTRWASAATSAPVQR